MLKEEKAGPGCLTPAQRWGREEVLSPKWFIIPSTLHVVMGWSHLLLPADISLSLFMVPRGIDIQSYDLGAPGFGEAVREVTRPALGPSPSSLRCVRVSFHSPVPRAWCKTTGDPIESPVLAVLDQETRRDDLADTGFSVGSTREGAVPGGFVIQHAPISLC